jgi:acyl carrier protein
MKVGRRQSGSDLVDRVEQRLSDCPLFTAVAVARDDGGLLVVVNPDLRRIWETGSADLNGIVRIELAEALRSIGAEEVQARIAITRARLPTRLDRQASGSDLRQFFREVYPAVKNEVGPPDGKNESPTVDTSALEGLWHFLRLHFPEHRLTRQTCPRLDFDLDSLDWLEFLLAAEEQTGIGLSEEIASGIITLGDLEAAFLEIASSPGEASLETRRRELLAAPHLYETMRARSRAARSLGFAIYWFNPDSSRTVLK